MHKQTSTPKRCLLRLTQWRNNLRLSSREQSQLNGKLLAMDRQLQRFSQRKLRLSVFGKVGVGKSSLLNALLEEFTFDTDVAHGSTRKLQSINWNQQFKNLQSVQLIDTPGIDEIAAAARARLARRIALQSDLIIVVLDSDLTTIEKEAIETLLQSGKQILLVLNRCDQWSQSEQVLLIQSIRRRLPKEARNLVIKAVSAAPRQVHLQTNGKVRSYPVAPQIEELRSHLMQLLESQGELLLALNALREADSFHQSLQEERLKLRKSKAQGLIGKFAAVKATSVAANPFLVLDLAGGLACDTALILELCKLYGLQMEAPSARQLVTKVSGQNLLLGGAQIGIQLVLGVIRQLLLLAAPLTSGLSLAPAAPVALVQAALAVHTTRLTGRLAALELVSENSRTNTQPREMLRRLAAIDPQVKRLLIKQPQGIKSLPLPTLLP